MFAEFSKELVYFCQRLVEECKANRHQRVYFLAREGQLLKQVFDRVVEQSSANIYSSYKYASRVSTFLPSLTNLEKESFETLFRQYRVISASEFLSSLGMGDLLEEIANEIGCDSKEFESRVEDFPTNDLFLKIKQSNLFSSEYENRRKRQRSLLQKYFLEDLESSDDVVVVDVGWKGTIQDHLYKALELAEGSRRIHGYYLGLLYATNESKRSTKKGLLFGRDKLVRSTYYWIFNENRALYELLLSADHGSTLSYRLSTSDDQVLPRFQPFVEETQFQTKIEPLQARFTNLVDQQLRSGNTEYTLQQIAKEHYRMVFRPTESEVELFQNMFQYENFGMFENTHFDPKSGKVFRLLSAIKAIIKADESKFGFWPSVYIRAKYGSFLAAFYKARIRYLP